MTKFTIVLIICIIIYVIYHNYYINTNSRIYSTESICGSFLNDIKYDSNNDVCQLPCKIITSYPIPSFQNNSKCFNSSLNIIIDRNTIVVNRNVSIIQHVVINKKHYKYKFVYPNFTLIRLVENQN